SVDAAGVDVDLVGIGAWHIERMDAAVFAKRVFCHAGVERVGGQIVLAAEQFEIFRRHDQVENSFLGADRTIADRDGVEIRGDAKAHAPAVTAALVIVRHWLTSATFLSDVVTTRLRLGRTGRTGPDRARARAARDA